MSAFLKSSGLAALALFVTAPAAKAAIRCVNGFQVVNGSLISTPYCQDELVARVARQYGVKTSPDAIRNNPNHKRNVCQFVGRDIRIQQACPEAQVPGRRGGH